MFTFAQMMTVLAAVVAIAAATFAAGYELARYKFRTIDSQPDGMSDYVRSIIEQIPDLEELLPKKRKPPDDDELNPIWQ